jgi:hypothetical protein
MKLSNKLRCGAVGLALLGVATLSAALTLGRASGSLLMGKSLDVTVQVQIERGEDVSGSCFEADVFYAETHQSSDQVVVVPESTSQRGVVSVRILSNTKVDEPVVTVYLRSGCGNKASRRYILLVDLADDLQLPKVVSAEISLIAKLPSGRAVLTPLAAVRQTEVSIPPASDRSTGLVAPSAKFRSLVNNTGTLKLAVNGTQMRPSLVRSGLQLGTAESESATDQTLTWSDVLIWPVADDAKSRVAGKWRSLTLTPPDILGDRARLETMESEIVSLRVKAVTDERLVSALGSRLEAANVERYVNPVAFGLLLTLLLCGFGLVVFLKKPDSLRGPRFSWWRGTFETDERNLEAREALPNAQVVTGSLASYRRSAAVGEVDIPLSDSVSLAPSLDSVDIALSPGEPQEKLSQLASLKFELLSINSKETYRGIDLQKMLNARQEADFLMTLGQHDDAIKVLRACVTDSQFLNPWIYLDLLRIFHKLSQKIAYDSFRQQFNGRFSGVAPLYTDFHRRGRSLEEYTLISGRVTALWPSDEVVMYIEKCLIHTPGITPSEGFDLEAFDDLLTLHAVATLILSEKASGVLAFGTDWCPPI